MKHFNSRTAVHFLLLITTAVFAGCNNSDTDDANLMNDDLFPLSENTSETPTAPALETAKLELKLKAGDRFPLIKTVERELSQSTLGQKLDKSTSRIEMVMAITVEEIRGAQKRLGVHYTRVKYSHKLPNEIVEYDSNSPPPTIPSVVRPYHGLVNNGFSFWIGADNQLIDLVGFDNFLNRCLRDVPVEERDQVVAILNQSSRRDGIVNFVDDSVGLLPYNVNDPGNASLVSVGSTWHRKHKTTQPVSMSVDQKYTLKELNDKVAKIDVMGTITPSTTFGDNQANGGKVQLNVKNGNTFGSCTIDVRTGLPIESRTEQFLDMAVSVGAGINFDQTSRVITTVRAFPQQTGTPGKIATTPKDPRAALRTLTN